MFHKFLTLIAMIIASKTVLAGGAPKDIYVVKYTTETYPTEMARRDNFVVFHQPGCLFYRHLRPTWEQLAQGRNGIPNGQVRIALVDCVADPALCTGIVPATIWYFKAGNSSRTEYTGALTVELFNNFIDLQLQG